MAKGLSWLLKKMGLKSQEQQYKQRIMQETANMDFTTLTHDWDKAKRLYDVFNAIHRKIMGL